MPATGKRNMDEGEREQRVHDRRHVYKKEVQ
jgi:hypothetical protein